MKPGRIAVATLGVGAALTVGAWTLSAAAVPLPAEPVSIPIVVPSQTLVAGLATTPTSDPARAVADAEARLAAINTRLQALVGQASTASSSVTTTPAATATSPPTPAAATPGAAPPAHAVTGASGSASTGGDDGDEAHHDADEQDGDEQDD